MARTTKPHRSRTKRRRRPSGEWRVVDVADAFVGPDVVVPRLEDVLTAINRAPHGDDWESARRLVIPMFPRMRPDPPGVPAGQTALVPPGVVIGFAVDIGPAVLPLNESQLATFGVTSAEVVSQALANVLLRAQDVDPAAVVRDTIDGVPVRVLQTGRSIASTLVLLSDVVRRLFGPEPSLLIAPMRDLLISFPVDVDMELVAWVFEEFASQDPNSLAPMAFRFDGRTIGTTSLIASMAPITRPM